MTSLEYFERRRQELLDELAMLVRLETPTGDVVRMEQAATFVAERLAPFGALEVRRLEGLGPLLHLTCPGRAARVLLLAHLDTVWPPGSWERPWLVEDGWARGPGVYDMKGGVLFIPWLLRCLDASARVRPHLEILVTPDEETGSRASRPTILAAAGRSDFVLGLEPSDLDGNLKLARKGSGEFSISIRGRSAHQGAEPERGVNAIVEAAHQVLALLELQDPAAGTTVGPNVIGGGLASNMVAERAEIRADVRAWTVAEQNRLEAGLRALQPVLEGALLTVRGGWNRPPLEPTPASIALFDRARELAADLGHALGWLRWGGASDANLAAAACAAVIDGLGPLGQGAHEAHEGILLDALPARLALLTELVASLAEPPEQWLDEEALAAMRSGRSSAAHVPSRDHDPRGGSGEP